MEQITTGEPEVSYPPGFDEVVAWAIKQEQDENGPRQGPAGDPQDLIQDIISAVTIYEIASTLSDHKARASIQRLAGRVAARGVQAMNEGI